MKKEQRIDKTAPMLDTLLPRRFTVEAALNEIGLGRFQYLMLCILGCTWVADLSEIILLAFLAPAVKCDWDLSDTKMSLISGIVFLGMGTGSFLCGCISDAYGRKVGVMLSTFIIGFVGLLTSFVPNHRSLLIARFIVGIGIGGMNNSFSLFAEFQPRDTRGVLLTYYEFGACIGVVLESALAWVVLPSYGWRGLVLITSFLPIPESPRYLIVNGKREKCYEVLRFVAKINGKTCPSGELYLPRTQAIVTERTSEKFKKQFKELFQYPLGRLTPVVWAMHFMTGLGYYSLLILSTTIQSEDEGDECEDGKLSLKDSDYFGFLLGAFGELGANILFVFIVDKFGRKKLFTALYWLYSLFLLPVVFFTSLKFVCMYFARALGSCMFIIVNVIAAETYPSTCRATGLVLALHDKFGLRFVEGFYSFLYFLGGMLAFLIPFETLGKPMSDSLNEVLDLYLTSNRPANNIAVL